MKCVRGEHPQLSIEGDAPGNTYQVARSMLAWRFNNHEGWNETIDHSLQSIRFARSFEFTRNTSIVGFPVRNNTGTRERTKMERSITCIKTS